MDAKGQSIIEVVIMLPLLFLFVALLYRLNMGLQMSINNIQYARSQIYILNGNSPEYPRLFFRHYRPDMFAAKQQDLMILGVSDPSALAEASEGAMPPIPQIQKIGRPGTVPGSEDGGEVAMRTSIRVRGTMGICTQLNSVKASVRMNSTNIPSLGSQRWPFGQLVCQYEGQWIGEQL